MGSPLIRRLPRQLRSEFGKYLGIFLLLAITISLVAGFLVAASSIKAMIDDMPARYNIEDARLTTSFEVDKDDLEKVSDKAGADIVPLFSIDDEIKWNDKSGDAGNAGSATVRLYENRDNVDEVAYVQGKAPESDDEIALDRVFCANNGLVLGDFVQMGNRNLRISGIMTLSDYSALFVKNSDFVFDALTFTVAQITPSLFDELVEEGVSVSFTYAVILNDRDLDLPGRIDAEETLLEELASTGIEVSDFIDREANQSISYAGSDVEGDQMMWKVLLMILLVIMAFVFVVLTSTTIEEESAIIGTLLASGYRKGELIRHYLALPAIVGVVAAIVGNVLGYTVASDPMRALYYNSYSLPPYEARWNTDVFVLTTIVPLVLLIGITFVGLVRKLGYTPLRFLHHDISKTGLQAQVRLSSRLSFSTRFRIRVFLRNLGNFVTLFFGIVFASLLLVFGLCMMPVVENYANGLKGDLVANHQYVLKMPVELEEAHDEGGHAGDKDVKGSDDKGQKQSKAPEKYAVTSLETSQFMGDGKEKVSVYGISGNSRYWIEPSSILSSDAMSAATKDATPVVIGQGLAEKGEMGIGDTRTFEDPLTGDEFEFEVVGLTASPSCTDVFMDLPTFNEAFGKDADFFNGYVSDEELDLDERVVDSDLTPSAMDRIVAQMNDSMGDMTSVLLFAAVLVYVVLMYLLTKTVIDRSAQSISYMKVFGYRNREVDKLYVRSVTETVVVSLVLSLPLVVFALSALVRVVFLRFNGNFTISVPPEYLVLAVIVGVFCYALIAFVHLRAIRRIPLSLALKAQE